MSVAHCARDSTVSTGMLTSYATKLAKNNRWQKTVIKQYIYIYIYTDILWISTEAVA